MFTKCNIYNYMGLYLNEKELEELKIQCSNGIAIIEMLKDYQDVYIFMDDEPKEIPIKNLYSLLSSSEGKYRDYCYRINNGCFILIPTIEVFYGILHEGNNLISCYKDKDERDKILFEIQQYGINDALIQDMNESRNIINEFVHQQQLTRIRDTLSMKI